MIQVYSPVEVHQFIQKQGRSYVAALQEKRMYCTPNFGWWEVFVNQTDIPTLFICTNLFKTTSCVQGLVRSYLFSDKPITITSGWRSQTYNAKVSKYPNSYHTKGMALDFMVHGVPSTVVRTALDPIWKYGMELNTPHVHLDIRLQRVRFNP